MNSKVKEVMTGKAIPLRFLVSQKEFNESMIKFYVKQEKDEGFGYWTGAKNTMINTNRDLKRTIQFCIRELM